MNQRIDSALPRSAPVMLERARGVVVLKVSRREGFDSIADLGQSGCGRLLFPHRAAGGPLEAAIVNTAGGLTGGDRFRIGVKVQAGASAVLTTQACEKIYRSGEGFGEVKASLAVDAGASLLWMPQETILFEGSALKRALTGDVAANGRLLVAEAVTLGRTAMGESIATARFRDSWRIRREGRLVFAEETAAEGPGWGRARAAKAGLGLEATAFATLLLVAPDAPSKLDPIRAILEFHGIDGGASVVDGLLVTRLVTGPGLALRRAMMPLIECLSGAPLPRVWTT